MVTLPYRYPLDPTGVSPDNLVVGEIHELPNRTVRAFAPLYGGFFSESVVVRDRATGLPLVKGTQYRAAELYEFPTGRWGKEICGIILVLDPAVSNSVELDYQALGGEYSTNVDAIISMLNDLMIDRPVSWPDIIGKPDEYNPAAHFHDAGDIYGFEYVVNAIERLRQAILTGDSASHDELLRYIDRQDQDIRDDMDAIQASINDHASNVNNPHNVTKAQVGLGSVENYPVATPQQATDGTGNAYMTPALVKQVVDALGDAFTDHINNTNNPHNTTKAHVGLGSVENYAVATEAESTTDALTNPLRYMTPLRVMQAIDFFAGEALEAHTSRMDNPHNTTKAQVGLGSVENYPVATQAEAQAGVSNTLYMTPLRVNERMAVHADSGDHDARYVRLSAAVSTSLREAGGRLEAYVNGAWRIVWPPQWQGGV